MGWRVIAVCWFFYLFLLRDEMVDLALRDVLVGMGLGWAFPALMTLIL